MTAKISDQQQLGLAGAAILFAGIFTPIFRIGGETATLAMTWVGALVGVAAVAAAIFVAMEQGWATLLAGVVALCAAGYRYLGMEKIRRDAVADITAGSEKYGEWGKAFAGGLADRLSDALSPAWGWAVIGLGIAMVLLAAVVLIRDENDS